MKLKKPEISFRAFDGAGPISVYWYDAPLGDAVEADGGNGVGWFAPNGELLAVEFDNVSENGDSQTLVFRKRTRVSVSTRAGKARVQLELPPGRSRRTAA